MVADSIVPEGVVRVFILTLTTCSSEVPFSRESEVGYGWRCRSSSGTSSPSTDCGGRAGDSDGETVVVVVSLSAEVSFDDITSSFVSSVSSKENVVVDDKPDTNATSSSQLVLFVIGSTVEDTIDVVELGGVVDTEYSTTAVVEGEVCNFFDLAAIFFFFFFFVVVAFFLGIVLVALVFFFFFGGRVVGGGGVEISSF